jgi:hypothetical protein
MDSRLIFRPHLRGVMGGRGMVGQPCNWMRVRVFREKMGVGKSAPGS